MSSQPPTLLFTGGLDSVAAWRLLGQPRCVYVMADTSIAGCEGAVRTAASIGVAELRLLSAPWPAPTREDGHIPLRNLHLISAAALEGDRVWLGATRGESSPDKSRRFLRATSHALTLAAGRRIQVEAPLQKWTKRQLVRQLVETMGFEGAANLIRHTRSCYSTEHARCGECMACFRRWVALSLNGIPETHTHPPWEWKRPGWGQRAGYLRRIPVGEWPGVAELNLEAALALALASR